MNSPAPPGRTAPARVDRDRALKTARARAEGREVEVPDRCPHCGAALPLAASWCPLCLEVLAPAAAPTPAAVAAPGPASVASAPAPPDAPPPGPPRTPAAEQPTLPFEADDPAVAPDVDAMLARLAAHEEASRVAVPGPLRTRAGKIAVCVGGAVLLALLLVVLLGLLNRG